MNPTALSVGESFTQNLGEKNSLKSVVLKRLVTILSISPFFQRALGEPAARGRQPLGAAPPEPRHRHRHTHHRRRRGRVQGKKEFETAFSSLERERFTQPLGGKRAL